MPGFRVEKLTMRSLLNSLLLSSLGLSRPWATV
jgi:hypothetical protein